MPQPITITLASIPDATRTAIADWCTANGIDPATVVDGLRQDTNAGVIRYLARAEHTDAPGERLIYTLTPSTVWAEVPLLVHAPEEWPS